MRTRGAPDNSKVARGIASAVVLVALVAGCSADRASDTPPPGKAPGATAPARPGETLQQRVHNGQRYTTINRNGSAQPRSTSRYPEFDNHGICRVDETPISTFAVDVDTASYANVRRLLASGRVPNPDAVRTEELVNYFSYDYAQPTTDELPFTLHTEIGPSPWHPGRHLLHIGLQGRAIEPASTPPLNLVFLIDVSGSMSAPDKLPLARRALGLLARQLRPQDHISLVVYAGAAGVVLPPVPGNETARIQAALDALHSGGSTNGGDGIRLAYAMAHQGFIEGGVNRVILATDGDFNVGETDDDTLAQLVARERTRGTSLSILGFGTGNYNDALMQQLAQIGDGNAGYIDTMSEARKLLVEELTGTLTTIARDVKVQLEFNPAVVAEYRLIGYETRRLAAEDFDNDQVDAGEIGAGHTVTALYELALVGSQATATRPLRYASAAPAPDVHAGELGELRLRFKPPQQDTSRELTVVLRGSDAAPDLAATSDNFRFAAAVAGFGQLLRGSEHLADFGYDDVVQLASRAYGTDAAGYRHEFVNLAKTAKLL